MSGAGLLALCGSVALTGGILAGLRSRTAGFGWIAQAGGMGMLGFAGALVLLGADPIGAPFVSAIDPSFGVDALSGFFLIALALVGCPALFYARSHLGGERSRVLGPLTGLFLAAMVGVIVARDPSTFLASWELISLIPAMAILVYRNDAAVRNAVFVYLAVTHLGGVGVWISILALAHFGAISDPGTLAAQGSGVEALVIVAAIVGFGTKAGLMPFHSWLPRAHPVAPAHLSALMSGVMIKVALYGLIRVLFEWAAPAPQWSGYLILAIGLLSALGGVLYALVQHDLKRLLAFHSIENVGIIALGLGASILFAGHGSATWAAIAFAAALLHTLNHAIFKGLLFLGAGAFERAAGSLDLDHMGGLLRRMPWTGGAFLVGAMAIAGVPPLNGFASEWLTLQSLIHLAIEPPAGPGIVGALAAAGLAATAALALYCFVKVVGLVLLGAPRRSEVAAATEAPLGMTAGMVSLAGLCIALGLAPGLLVPKLAALAPGPGRVESGAGLEIPGTGSLPSPWLALGLAATVALLWRLRGRRRSVPAPAWACGQEAAPDLAWTSAAFTKPLRLVLDVVLRPRREVVTTREGGLLEQVTYRSEIPHLFDTLLYRPLNRGALKIANVSRRLQSGSVSTYAAYLLALLVALLVLTRIGALG